MLVTEAPRGQRCDPRSSVDVDPDVLRRIEPRLAGVDPDADPDRARPEAGHRLGEADQHAADERTGHDGDGDGGPTLSFLIHGSLSFGH